ncbi:MAG: tRNA uridine-5-carboxymethylaminomethyl(34) synthesis GTPase MnmE, partial [Chitinophagaceae bacterium]
MYFKTNLSTWEDTIIALSTPPGVSGIAVIRISGEKALEIINRLYHKKDLAQQSSHTAHVGYLEHEEEILDEVVLTIFKNPTSFTGENMVEISCHGSPFVIENIIKTCVQGGARVALPGEFTQRAFINGKIDLIQAEAVADIIHAQSQAAARLALQNIRGGFSKDIATLREQLIEVAALLELELDFSDEDVEFADRLQFHNLLQEILQKVQLLAQSFGAGNAIKQGVKVAIIGKPNAGKSTLLNALLNEDRVLVSDIEGTTRDTVEETIFIQGIKFLLIDTAGLRNTTDFLEAKAIERTQKIMHQADAILYIFDISKTSLQEIKQLEKEYPIIAQKNTLWVANKTDIATPLQKE